MVPALRGQGFEDSVASQQAHAGLAGDAADSSAAGMVEVRLRWQREQEYVVLAAAQNQVEWVETQVAGQTTGVRAEGDRFLVEYAAGATGAAEAPGIDRQAV